MYYERTWILIPTSILYATIGRVLTNLLTCVDLISQINGLCLAQLVVCGASPPRVTVEFELVRALARTRGRFGLKLCQNRILIFLL